MPCFLNLSIVLIPKGSGIRMWGYCYLRFLYQLFEDCSRSSPLGLALLSSQGLDFRSTSLRMDTEKQWQRQELPAQPLRWWTQPWPHGGGSVTTTGLPPSWVSSSCSLLWTGTVFLPLMMSLSPDDISRNDGKLQLVLNLSSSRVIENQFFFAFPLYFQPSPAEQGQRSKTLSACPQDLHWWRR